MGGTWMTKELAQSVLALVIVVLVVVGFGGKLLETFSSKEVYKKSFNEFVDGLEEFWKGSRDSDLLFLSMEEGSAVFGFAKEAQRIEKQLRGKESIYIKKPAECKDNSCICLCSDVRPAKSSFDNGVEIICYAQMRCSPLEGIDIQDSKENELVAETLLIGSGEDILKGGFVLYRKGALHKDQYDLLILKEPGDKDKKIRVEKSGKKIRVCDVKAPGCFEREEVSSKQEEVFEEWAKRCAREGRIFLSEAELSKYVGWASEKYNLDNELIFAIMQKESNFDACAENKRSMAKGLMQLTPIAINDLTAESGASRKYCEGVATSDFDYFNPEKNIKAGSCYFSYLSRLYKKGDIKLSLAAYNFGVGNMERECMNKWPCEKAPTETKEYVREVCRDYDERKGTTGCGSNI